MSEQKNVRAFILQRPTTSNSEEWASYWETQGQHWRTEPEIPEERQKELEQYRTIVPDIKKDTYPFRGIELTRADVEWLLATHENGLGPVDWRNKSRKERQGLDLRGALLAGIDLSDLPLTRTIGGIPRNSWLSTTPKQKEAAAIHLKDAILSRAHMEGSELGGAHLERANCYKAHFEYSFFRDAYLGRAYFRQSYLVGANFRLARLQGTNFRYADLQRAVLKEAFMDSATTLSDAIIGNGNENGIVTADVRWNDANLAVVDWSRLKISGDEYRAKNSLEHDEIGEHSMEKEQLSHLAVRAYRQLAIALRNQGVNEEADRFAYRAQVMQRTVFRLQNNFGQYLFSLLLDLIVGYGFKPVRWIYIYIGIVVIFTVLHSIVGMPHLPLFSAISMSVLDLHGRPFLSSPSGVEGTIAIVEAFIGLIVEAILIAIVTQRILGK
jgi:uncharacterized protein YjbI with pentapeptide repeats